MADHKNEDLQKQLMDLFLVEAQEYLEKINCHVLSLEESKELKPGDEGIEEMLRSAHSLKGASRAVNLNDIESRAHRLESLFVNIQSGQTALNRKVFDSIYRSLDEISALLKKVSGEAVDNDGSNKEPDRLQYDKEKPEDPAVKGDSQSPQREDQPENGQETAASSGKGARQKKPAVKTADTTNKKQL